MDNWRRLGAGWRSLGAAALVLPLMGVSVALGATYNVYPPGYAGTKTQPAFTGLLAAYFTCAANGDGNKACPVRVLPGDTILVHAGTYIDTPSNYGTSSATGLGTTYDGTYYLTGQGTPDKPISIVAAGDGPVIFDGGGILNTPRNHNLFNVMAANYNVFQGITVRNTDIGFLAGINGITGATGFTIKNVTTQNVRNLICNQARCLTYGHNSHDFNGDGTSDILWRDSSGDLAMWLMSAGQEASGAGLGQVPTNWSVVGSRDFNGDGMSDILWHDSSGDVAIWLMNGTTFSSGVSLGNVGTQWSVAGTGDFNADGTGDILWRNTSTGDLAIWLMSNGTLSSGVDLGVVPLSWQVAGVGDFNGDGTSDILWRNTSTGELTIWFLSQGRYSSAVDLGAVPLTWNVAGTGDFNGDGTADIAWLDNSGHLAIWLMSEGQYSSSAMWQMPTNWSVAETGDFNDDGMSDILWTDTSGNIAIWLMDGLTVSAYDGLGNVGTSWTVQGINAD